MFSFKHYLYILFLFAAMNAFAQKDSLQQSFIGPEAMPSYKGGFGDLKTFIYERLRYPEPTVCMPPTGKVFVSFYVLEDGTLNDFKILRGVSDAYNAEAIRVLKLTSGNWIPGQVDGKAVKMRMNMPVNFSIK